MNLLEKYQAINEVIENYLLSKSIKCPVYKYGIDPFTTKVNKKNNVINKYPYIQTFVSNIKENAWTSEHSGIYTTFNYQLNFFTSPDNELVDDVKLFYPFEVTKNALADTQLQLLKGIANINRKKGNYAAEVKGGQFVPSAFIIYEMDTVCTYEAIVPGYGDATDLSSAIKIQT